MFRLTREVRFAVNAAAGRPARRRRPTNGLRRVPVADGPRALLHAPGHAGRRPLDPRSQYLRNIKEIDEAVRDRARSRPSTADVRAGRFAGGGCVAGRSFDLLTDAWPGVALDALRLSLSPFLAYAVLASEYPMVRLSQKFEFSASAPPAQPGPVRRGEPRHVRQVQQPARPRAQLRGAGHARRRRRTRTAC